MSGEQNTNQTSILAKLKAQIALPNTPYKRRKIGSLGLQRSIIPQEDCDRVVTHLDHGTNELIATQALQLRLTPDELIRQLLWLLMCEL